MEARPESTVMPVVAKTELDSERAAMHSCEIATGLALRIGGRLLLLFRLLPLLLSLMQEHFCSRPNLFLLADIVTHLRRPCTECQECHPGVLV